MDYQEFKELLKNSSISEFPNGFDRPCTATDYSDFVSQAAIRSRKIAEISTAEALFQCNDQDFMLFIIFIGENNQLFPWNNSEIVKNCKIVEEKLTGVLHASIPTILGDGCKVSNRSNIRPLLKPILMSMRPKMLKETWKRNPGTMECFYWLLMNSKPNRLCDHMQHVLPTALLLLDDFDSDNQALGVKCISRVLDDMTLAEMKFHGYGQLIYKPLQVLLYESDENLASLVLPCLIRLVTKLETDLQGNKDVSQWSMFDDVAEIILDKMGMEQKIRLRAVYVNFVKDLIQALKGRIHRWAKRLLIIFDSYLDTAGTLQDFDAMENTLETVVLFIKSTKDVRAWYRDSVLLTLMRSLYFIEKYKPESSQRLCSLIQQCIKELFEGLPEEKVSAALEEISQPMYDDEMGNLICKKFMNIALK